jgi:hypothetical protein
MQASERHYIENSLGTVTAQLKLQVLPKSSSGQLGIHKDFNVLTNK